MFQTGEVQVVGGSVAIKDAIKDNLAQVNRRIAEAAGRAGRDSSEITLVAVTKNVPVELIRLAVDAGVTILGENRVQEAESKVGKIDGQDGQSAQNGRLSWHMIGHLQRNKAKKAVALFDAIQSVDSLDLALEIDKRAAEASKRIDVYVEVNTSGEASKFGARPEESVDLVGRMSHLRHISVRGLMTIGALTDDEQAIRACFRRLRDLREQIQRSNFEGVGIDYLSMGMTSDFEIAIEEGSNMVRIGTAIFGPRGPSGPRQDLLAT